MARGPRGSRTDATQVQEVAPPTQQTDTTQPGTVEHALFGPEPTEEPPADAELQTAQAHEVEPPPQAQQRPAAAEEEFVPPEEEEEEAEPEAQREPPAEGQETLQTQQPAELRAEGEARKRPSWTELRDARRERDELRQRVAQIEQQQQQQQQQLMQARAALTPGQAQPQGTPGVDRPYTPQELAQLEQEDPILHARLIAQGAQQAAEAQARQIAVMQQQFAVRSQVEDFTREHPDYPQAMQLLRDREAARLRKAGFTDQRIPLADGRLVPSVQDMLEARANMLVESALMQGKSVAQVAYDVAIEEGHTVPQARAAAAAAEEPPARKETPQERVRQSQQRTQLAETSVTTIPGTAAGRPLITKADVMRMSEAEMDRLDKEQPGWEQFVQ